MKKLFGYADAYIKESTWKDLALIKFCLAAIGLLIGLEIPQEKKLYSIFIPKTIPPGVPGRPAPSAGSMTRFKA